jgi:hypothetical protein
VERIRGVKKPHDCRVRLFRLLKVFSAPVRQFTPRETIFLDTKQLQKLQRRLVCEPGGVDGLKFSSGATELQTLHQIGVEGLQDFGLLGGVEGAVWVDG